MLDIIVGDRKKVSSDLPQEANIWGAEGNFGGCIGSDGNQMQRNAASLKVTLFLGLAFSFLSSSLEWVSLSPHSPSPSLSIHLSPQQLFGLGGPMYRECLD